MSLSLELNTQTSPLRATQSQSRRTANHSVGRHSVFAYVVLTLSALLSPLAAQAQTSSQTPTELVGSIEGDATVEQGQLAYGIPLNLPAGVNGTTPSLALTYRAGNGIVGLGFGLAGPTHIQRCAANLTIDGYQGRVGYNSEDRYCLGSERLIAITGRPGGNATEYRLANNRHSRIRSYGQHGNGPSNQRNSRYRYDANGNQLEGNGRTLTWTADNKPKTIRTNNTDAYSHFAYDHGGERVIQTQQHGQTRETTVYAGPGYEKITRDDAQGHHVEHKHHIKADGQIIATQVRYLERVSSPPRLRVLGFAS